jgi:hypothetical protein
MPGEWSAQTAAGERSEPEERPRDFEPVAEQPLKLAATVLRPPTGRADVGDGFMDERERASGVGATAELVIAEPVELDDRRRRG